ncbi:MAG: putative toxin-antitoxin system toxin component, PIN family [Syntrophaceae bacterium]|nr:putative toxin-antitoxin system toxin component, PIN family [Syntrophaceae bacterium]
MEAVSRALKEHDVFLSASLLQELEGASKKLSKKLSPEKSHYLQEKVGELLKAAHRIPVSTPMSLSRGPRDDHDLGLCKEARADFLITGDKDLLSLHPEALEQNGISCRIINPASFLEFGP